MAKTVRIEEIGGCEGNCIAINEYRIAGPKPWGGGHVIRKWVATVDDIVKALGVDVAEVVRCKECKHCTPDENIVGGYGDCFYKDDIHSIVNADDFCSYGERRTNEQG